MTKPKRPALKRCPFCNNKEMVELTKGNDYNCSHVRCWECDAKGPLTISNSEAIKAWNHRATRRPKK